MNDYFKRVQAATPTRFWINNVTTEEAELALGAGAVGCTQNPTYVWKILQKSNEDSEKARALFTEAIKMGLSDADAVAYVQLELIAAIAKHFEPLWVSSNGARGYVSIQSDPFVSDSDYIVQQSEIMHKRAPNLMSKIPVCEDGLKAIAAVSKLGIAVNATECMSVQQVIEACEAYTNAVKDLDKKPVMCFSLIPGIFEEEIKAQIADNYPHIPSEAAREAGFSLAKKTYEIVKSRGYNCEFVSGGARGLHHFTDLVGADVAVTINWKGTAKELVELDGPVERDFDRPINTDYVNMLLDIPVFAKAYNEGGITTPEFDTFEPVERFKKSFTDAWGAAKEYVSKQR